MFFIKNYILPSPLGDWNNEYRPFFIQITKIPSKKLANTEYRYIIRPPLKNTWYYILRKKYGVQFEKLIAWTYSKWLLIFLGFCKPHALLSPAFHMSPVLLSPFCSLHTNYLYVRNSLKLAQYICLNKVKRLSTLNHMEAIGQSKFLETLMFEFLIEIGKVSPVP